MTKRTINGIEFSITSKGAFLSSESKDVNIFSSDFQDALAQLKTEYKRLAKKFSSVAYVYIGRGMTLNGKSLYKIGSSYRPLTRLENDCREILFTIPVKDRAKAYELEYELHARYITKATRFSEWFALTEDDLATLRTLAND